MVAVARNPVTVDYARGHAAVGALKRAIAVGPGHAGRGRGPAPSAMVEAACGPAPGGEDRGPRPVVAGRTRDHGAAWTSAPSG